MTCAGVDDQLGAYVDRELDRAAMDAVRDHLRDCAACRGRLAGLDALGRLVRAVPSSIAPAALRARVRAARRRRMAAWLAPLAAAAVIVMAASGALVLRERVDRGPASAAEAVVDSHVRSLMADHLFDVQSTDQHTVKPWFLGRLDFAPPVVDLAADGFPLVGGRLDYLQRQPVAALVYRRRGHAINLFVGPDGDGAASPPERRTVRGFHVVHWESDGMTFWAVSDLNESELLEFAAALDGR